MGSNHEPSRREIKQGWAAAHCCACLRQDARSRWPRAEGASFWFPPDPVSGASCARACARARRVLFVTRSQPAPSRRRLALAGACSFLSLQRLSSLGLRGLRYLIARPGRVRVLQAACAQRTRPREPESPAPEPAAAPTGPRASVKDEPERKKQKRKAMTAEPKETEPEEAAAAPGERTEAAAPHAEAGQQGARRCTRSRRARAQMLRPVLWPSRI